MGVLLEWANVDIVEELRLILRARGTEHPTEEECKEWARWLVRQHAPRWPRYPLTPEQLQVIGARFLQFLQWARGEAQALDGTPRRSKKEPRRDALTWEQIKRVKEGL